MASWYKKSAEQQLNEEDELRKAGIPADNFDYTSSGRKYFKVPMSAKSIVQQFLSSGWRDNGGVDSPSKTSHWLRQNYYGVCVEERKDPSGTPATEATIVFDNLQQAFPL